MKSLNEKNKLSKVNLKFKGRQVISEEKTERGEEFPKLL